MARQDPPSDVAAIRREIRRFYDSRDAEDRRLGSAKFGIYAFYDYDGEPIYVGQTREGLSTRIGRHLTGQRSDSVAKSVLDPFEVFEVEAWPLWDLQEATAKDPDVKARVNAAEYTVFQKALAESEFGAVLNEGTIAPMDAISLPESTRQCIIPDNLVEIRKHADVRISRRAGTIAQLARGISEREPSKGLRLTLLTQARRLERLAESRLADFADDPLEIEDEDAKSSSE
ncbi:MAG: GIY-YIG nuclease family protein [Solirubrobacterales bacterium]